MMRSTLRWGLVALFPVFLAACDDGDDQAAADAAPLADAAASDTGADATTVADAGIPEVTAEHEQLCMLVDSVIRPSDGYDVPGTAGAPRWGIPGSPSEVVRVRRSWSTLTDEEKRAVLDAFVALKGVTLDSGDPGSARVAYNSFCEINGEADHQKTLYDYYVEAHMSAFVSLKSADMTANQAPHKGPHFLPWHRYLLLRFEADLAEVIGDPDFALPYWDWTDCHADGDPSTCDPIFERDFLGTPGGCDGDTSAVEGYLVDQGFTTNLYNSDNPQETFSPTGVVCRQRHLRREVGCDVALAPAPPSADDIAGIFDRTVYDSVPYDACYTDPAVSFRQYLEGFDNQDTEVFCLAAGCGFHGLGHNYIGGDMTSNGTPNDPMFFLHHAGVDRMWAAWQKANIDQGATADGGNPGYPGAWQGALFNWPAVQVAEMFDYEALGYTYDVLPTP